MTQPFAVLATALLFGGVSLYAFAFAAFLFKALPPKEAGAALRPAFPWFYAFVIMTAFLAGLLRWPQDSRAAALMTVIVLITLPVRQWLMPAINRATDSNQRARFQWVHGLSVVVTVAHIAASSWLLAQLG